MIDSTTAAFVFGIFTVVGVIFQFALAMGAPWGEMTIGGKFPGRLPPKMRVAALVQLVLLVFIGLIVLTRAGIIFEGLFDFSKYAIWFVVALCAVSAILNTITPSKKERMLWAPVTIILFICAFVVAMSQTYG